VVVVGLFIWYLLGHTPFGRYLTSVGSNPGAARLVGLRVDWIKLSAFVLSGTIAGLAGVLLVANNGNGAPQAGSILDTLSALAAVFLGATAIRPGTFNIEGTIIAIYFVGFTLAGLEIAGAPTYVNDVFNGSVLFLAVIISTVIRQHRTGTA
jgi:ribose transport system permease protein